MRRSPLPAYLVAVLALVVALGGGAYAAGKLPKNSVGTKQLKSNAVTAAKVKDGSLTAADFAAGQLPAGPPGPKGADGQAITAFQSLPATVASTFVDLAALPGVGTVSASCQQMIGAGEPVKLALRYVVGPNGQRLLVESDGAVDPGAGVFNAGVNATTNYPNTTAEVGRLIRFHVSGTRTPGGAPYAATFTVSAVAKEQGLNRCGVGVVVTGG